MVVSRSSDLHVVLKGVLSVPFRLSDEADVEQCMAHIPTELVIRT